MVILQPRNVSVAEDLYDLGAAIHFNQRCWCYDCRINHIFLVVMIVDWMGELAQLWHHANTGLIFRGLIQKWDEHRIADELGYRIPTNHSPNEVANYCSTYSHRIRPPFHSSRSV